MRNLFIFILSLSISSADVPAVHGMLLFGGKTLYASHLPMFHSPHDYQVIVEVSLNDLPNSKALLLYKHSIKGGNILFTLVPDPMDLTKIIDGSMTSFHASLFQGHFEKGGKNLGQIQVFISKVIYSKKLNAPEAPPANDEYLVFGNLNGHFAAHLIYEKPSFDSILSVSAPYTISDQYCRTRACGDPIKSVISDKQLPLILESYRESSLSIPTVGDQIGVFGSTFTDVTQVLYSETNDLSF